MAGLFGIFDARRRRNLKAQPFPEPWLAVLRENVFLYRALSEAEQTKVQDLVKLLVAEKRWEGCDGLTITDDVRVTIAGQAALLLLGFEDYCFDELKTILVYPGGYLAVDVYGSSEQVAHRLGEAHHKGPVILSWWNARWTSRRLGHQSLVLHEFAHKLAELGDAERGMPPIDDPDLARRWESVTTAELDRLREDASYDRPTLLDPYGATNEAEFFAVTTECFFLQPVELRRRHAKLYELFATWFRQDPATRYAAKSDLLSQTDDPDEEYLRHAIAECSAAIRLHPDLADAYLSRADLYCQQAAYDQAITDYDTAIRLTSDDARTEAYCDRGIVHRWMNEYEKALSDFDLAIQSCPDYARAFCERGVTHAECGDVEKALADLDRAIRIDPQDDVALLERGRVHAEARQFEKAVKDYSKAIKLNPHEPELYHHRAEAYAALGETEKAARDRSRAGE